MNGNKQEGLYMIEKIISGEVVERRKTRIYRRPLKRGGRTKGNSSEKKIVGNREHAKLQLAPDDELQLYGGGSVADTHL